MCLPLPAATLEKYGNFPAEVRRAIRDTQRTLRIQRATEMR